MTIYNWRHCTAKPCHYNPWAPYSQLTAEYALLKK